MKTTITGVKMNIPKLIEESKARLKELKAKDDKIWRAYKSGEEALEPLKREWHAAYDLTKTEHDRLAGLKMLLAEADAQAISVVPEPANRVEAA